MKKLLFLSLSLYSAISIAADQTTPAPQAPPAEEASKIEAVGQVIWAKGTVSASLPNQTKRSLARKAEIYKEDTVESDASSTAQINLTDGTLLAITENTKIQLQQYHYNKQDPSKDSYVMNIAKGGLRTITGEIGKNNPKETKTKTPIATLSTLGTEFVVNVDGQKVVIGVLKGKVEAVNLKGQTMVLDNLNHKYLVINVANQRMNILNKMPMELKGLGSVKFQDANIINKTTSTTPGSKKGGGGGGGFCVGK